MTAGNLVLLANSGLVREPDFYVGGVEAALLRDHSHYLRKLLVHGARSALPSLAARRTPLGIWLKNLLQRAHKNTVIAALANKLARIVWAVLRRGGTYDAATLKAT